MSSTLNTRGGPLYRAARVACVCRDCRSCRRSAHYGLRRRLTNSGFTLVEVAIVLIIVGLVLGGVFKGQSLIDSARVRSIASEVTGFYTAWYAFQDRYRSIPGDFARARSQIDNAAVDGNGNGVIDDDRERAAVWQQLALAGFIHGEYDGASEHAGGSGDLQCSPGTCPQNPFAGYYKISYSAQAADAARLAHEIFTGDRIPVKILAELDRKIDDGLATSGRFRVHRAYQTSCASNDDWNVAAASANCAGVLRE